MNEAARWRQLDRLLEELEEVPEAAREERLETLCTDPELRTAVRRLWAAAAQSGGYLAGLLGDAAGAGNGPESDGETPGMGDLSGRHVGPYRLLRLAGRGGMGAVYEAERADGSFEQRVAVKLLPIALAGGEGHARFLAERRILAGLDHPAIARILDGGVTEDGTPWFAMEYVDGEPIDVHCDRHRLEVPARLELFLEVCDAVEHAHRRLVVHRDLKPGNVLVVMPEPGEPAGPRVRLLDFGIAKLTGGTGDDAPGGRAPTRAALRLMTPEYASPEQVQGSAVTTASDVYQLGLLLYELLTGRRPRPTGAGLRAAAERGAAETPPPRPSTMVLRTGPGAGAGDALEIAAARSTTPARLARRLGGDLDTVVLQALQAEPERRYGSVDRLAQDLRRHLAGLPVAARADSWVYRGRKFLERHAVGATATALGLLAALGLTAGLVAFHTGRIRSERNLAEAERDRARIETAKAEQVSSFLIDLFRGADPRETRGEAMTVRELLQRGVARVEGELAGQPEVQADMLQVLGRTHLELGRHGEARQLLERALAWRRENLGEAHLDTAETRAALGVLDFRQGDFAAARDLLEEAAAVYAADYDQVRGEAQAARLAEVLRVLGPALHRLGDHEAGLALLERAARLQAASSGRESEPVAVILSNQGVMQAELGRLEQSERLHERALEIREEIYEEDHPWLGINLSNLASVRLLRGRIEGTEPMLRRSLAILERAYGSDHPTVGVARTNLGTCLTLAGRPEEAEAEFVRAERSLAGALGAGNPQLAMPVLGRALAARAAGRPHEARAAFRRTLELRGRPLDAVATPAAAGPGSPEPDPFAVRALVGLAAVEEALGRPAVAADLRERALPEARAAVASSDPLLEAPLLDLGRWLTAAGRCAEAAPLLGFAQQIQNQQAEPLNAPRGEATRLLAACEG